MLGSIDGQVAWVTGAGSGIGLAAARALAAAGAKVALTGRRVEPLEAAAAQIQEQGGSAMVVPGEVNNTAAVEAAALRLLRTWGRCDILVNAAGINIPNRSWSTVEPDGFDAVSATDLGGCFYTSRAALPAMRAQGGGLIIQISSWSGRHVTRLTGPAYSAAKHALNALSESINQSEFENGIRSCCICPGEVATPILDKRPVPVTDEDKARMLQPQDLGETILFVARLPASVCVNEILISPTWNSAYVGSA